MTENEKLIGELREAVNSVPDEIFTVARAILIRRAIEALERDGRDAARYRGMRKTIITGNSAWRAAVYDLNRPETDAEFDAVVDTGAAAMRAEGGES